MSASGRETARGPADAPRIIEALSRAGVEYVVIGGYAVIAHGYARITQDLDIVPRPDPRNYARLARALGELDPEFRLPGGRRPDEVDEIDFGLGNVSRFHTPAGELNVILEPEGICGGYEQLEPRSIEVEAGGLRVRVAGRDDLIRMKRAMGRSQDLEDIAAIEDAERRRE